MTMDLVVSQSAEVRAEALAWPDQARALSIVDAARYREAGEMLKSIKGLRGRIAETFDAHIQRAFTLHRALCREKQEAEAPLVEAEQILKRGLVAYDDEQERLRRAEEHRRHEAARQQEEARRIAEAAALELEAHQTGDAALLDQALDLLDQPIQTPTTAPVPKATPKVAGLSFSERWQYRIVDVLKVPREYLKVDEVKIGSVVRAMKGATVIPGVEVYMAKGVSASGR